MSKTLAVRDHHPNWQKLYADAVSDPAELLRLLDLEPELANGMDDAQRQFSLRVPRGFIARMEPGNRHDPLLLQVLPLPQETALQPTQFIDDPVDDHAAMLAPGLLQKYSGRALLVATGACAINCRYCFRRHFPYADANAASANWGPALEQLAGDRDITEVILSGGDPLVLSDRRLRALTDHLRELPHIRTLRIHTRMPIVLPERIDEGLLEWLTGLHQQIVVVLHGNHPAEFDANVDRACGALRGVGATLLNQSVLLRRINDRADTLIALSRRLFEAQVLPYYLHALDPVRGAAHFDVPDGKARSLVEQMRRALPGYLVPTLVRETPGEPNKTPL
ncbi:EF-P beta-lysylation protein EpmB [Natronocella acetinitrilica]|uniref:L-lysine 2,3-aminomutase n=1 Tax=Natronocella acetinitrilica TaxID=414046 RepID=A0AAE3G2Y8_9GAMM|nr:EF-P beta-lysylation protein EpmB [Natronocella acetinitrilica]MCP1673736.1 EF-P beta-lysylation protein EpmB [Natronocella acetinitrilica]